MTPPDAPQGAVKAPQAKQRGKSPKAKAQARREAQAASHASPVVMITTVHRAEARAATLASLAAAGLPDVTLQVQTDKLGQANQRRNVHAALLRVLRDHPEAPGVLLVEDDIEAAETLGEWLAFVERQEHPVTFYAHNAERHWPPRLAKVARGERTPSVGELVTLRDIGTWWGSQCLWLPMPLVRTLAEHPLMPIHERGYGPFDSTLATLLREWGACMLGVAPGLVQHAALPNLNQPSKPRHMAASYSRTVTVPRERT